MEVVIGIAVVGGIGALMWLAVRNNRGRSGGRDYDHSSDGGDSGWDSGGDSGGGGGD